MDGLVALRWQLKDDGGRGRSAAGVVDAAEAAFAGNRFAVVDRRRAAGVERGTVVAIVAGVGRKETDAGVLLRVAAGGHQRRRGARLGLAAADREWENKGGGGGGVGRGEEENEDAVEGGGDG